MCRRGRLVGGRDEVERLLRGERPLEDALATMRRSGVHVARAFDEHGATSGVVFLEDIIEELVGEVRDATRRLF